jgi:hypothetical protein
VSLSISKKGGIDVPNEKDHAPEIAEALWIACYAMQHAGLCSASLLSSLDILLKIAFSCSHNHAHLQAC